MTNELTGGIMAHPVEMMTADQRPASTAFNRGEKKETPPQGAPDSEERERRRKEKAREKRKKLIGLAKAVDRGQTGVVTYGPAGDDGKSWRAASGLPDLSKPFLALGIESSCDDTGAAVVRSDGTILGEALQSQGDIHEPWGGVVPGLAMEAHQARIDGVVERKIPTK